MTDDPIDELLEDEGIVELIEVAVAIWDSVPLWIWLVVLFAAFKLISDFSDQARDERTTVPEQAPRQRDGPSWDEYTIHDDLDDDRTYEPPSESDPIVVQNEVDRSLLGKLKRLAGIGRSRSRD